MVTHDLEFAYRLGDRFTVLIDGAVAASGDAGEIFSLERFQCLFGLVARTVRDGGESFLHIYWNRAGNQRKGRSAGNGVFKDNVQ